VLTLIDAARTRAIAAVNTTLIDLYWKIGEYISRKIADEGWGHGTVNILAEYIRRHDPNARGFSSQNLWRMRQFYETYRGQPKLSTLLRELPWSHNMEILSRSKMDEEREFYLRMASRERWSFRDLQRQLNGALPACARCRAGLYATLPATADPPLSGRVTGGICFIAPPIEAKSGKTVVSTAQFGSLDAIS